MHHFISDIDEAHTLNSTLSTQPLSGYNPSSSASDNPASLTSLGLVKLELSRKSVSSCNVSLEAYLNEIRRDNLTYKACNKEGCKKKVSEKPSGGYECRSCGRVDGFQHRYMMKASISDETDHQWVTAFEDGAKDVFGMGANDLMQLRYIEQKAKSCHWVQVTFYLRHTRCISGMPTTQNSTMSSSEHSCRSFAFG